MPNEFSKLHELWRIEVCVHANDAMLQCPGQLYLATVQVVDQHVAHIMVGITRFRLVHVHTEAELRVTGRVLPDWGSHVRILRAKQLHMMPACSKARS